MTIKRKINITLLALGVIVLLSVFLVINPIFGQIKKGSESFFAQKEKLIGLEAKIKSLQDFRTNFKQYQPNLEKIDSLFVNTAEPIEFIKFLEDEAAAWQITIEIFPITVSEFNLNLEGPFSNFSRFLERVEYGPYLIKLVNLNIRKISKEDNMISAALLINTYSK